MATDLTPERRQELEENAMESFSYISRLASGGLIDRGALGPLEKFIDQMEELSGIQFPLIDPQTRTPVRGKDGSILLQKDYRLGLTQLEINALSR